MKFKLNIAGKIGLAFGIITVVVIINAALTNNTLKKSKRFNAKIVEVYAPSLDHLRNLADLVKETRILIRSWVLIEQKENTPKKFRLKQIHEHDFPETAASLKDLADNWDEAEKRQYDSIYLQISKDLFERQDYVMTTLASWDDYDDPMKMFEISPMVEDDGEMMLLTDTLVTQLNSLIRNHDQNIASLRTEMSDSFSRLTRVIVVMGIILFFVIAIMAGVTIRSITKPIDTIRRLLLQMAQGILPDKKIKEGNDEIGQISIALNKLVKGLKGISNFAEEVGKGNFESEFKPLSNEDNLGNSLLNMRNELKNAAQEEEKRKIEDEQRNWATQGIAKFGEILRKNNDDMEKLSFNIISELVKYANANQGGLFMVNDNDPDHVFIELSACYAYDRKKYLEKQIEIGVGLIGRCFQEKETIFLTDIPKEYINITSGLGADTPRSLILVPLIVNEEIFGVIEMASFKVFEKYQVEFLERIAETIASTISSVKINMQTATLLEQSQQQAEEMATQEEEMRQNIEELRSTQEESERRENELKEEVTQLRLIINKNNIEINN